MSAMLVPRVFRNPILRPGVVLALALLASDVAAQWNKLNEVLSRAPGEAVVGVAQHPTLNQFVVKVACEQLPDGYVPESFSQIGDAFRREREIENQRERDAMIKDSIHF